MLSSSSAGADDSLFGESGVQGFARGMSGEGKGEHSLRYVHLVNNEDSCFLISSGTLECRGSTLPSSLQS